jgi:hypothetical protein
VYRRADAGSVLGAVGQAADQATGTGLGSAAVTAAAEKDAEKGLKSLGHAAAAAAASAGGPWGLAAAGLIEGAMAIFPLFFAGPRKQDLLADAAWKYIQKTGARMPRQALYLDGKSDPWRRAFRAWLALHLRDAQAGLAVLGMRDKLLSTGKWPYPPGVTERMLWEDFWVAMGWVKAAEKHLRPKAGFEIKLDFKAPPRLKPKAGYAPTLTFPRLKPKAGYAPALTFGKPALVATAPGAHAPTTPRGPVGGATATPAPAGGGGSGSGGGSGMLVLAGVAAVLLMSSGSRGGSTTPRSS